MIIKTIRTAGKMGALLVPFLVLAVSCGKSSSKDTAAAVSTTTSDGSVTITVNPMALSLFLDSSLSLVANGLQLASEDVVVSAYYSGVDTATEIGTLTAVTKNSSSTATGSVPLKGDELGLVASFATTSGSDLKAFISPVASGASVVVNSDSTVAANIAEEAATQNTSGYPLDPKSLYDLAKTYSGVSDAALLKEAAKTLLAGQAKDVKNYSRAEMLKMWTSNAEVAFDPTSITSDIKTAGGIGGFNWQGALARVVTQQQTAGVVPTDCAQLAASTSTNSDIQSNYLSYTVNLKFARDLGSLPTAQASVLKSNIMAQYTAAVKSGDSSELAKFMLPPTDPDNPAASVFTAGANQLMTSVDPDLNKNLINDSAIQALFKSAKTTSNIETLVLQIPSAVSTAITNNKVKSSLQAMIATNLAHQVEMMMRKANSDGSIPDTSSFLSDNSMTMVNSDVSTQMANDPNFKAAYNGYASQDPTKVAPPPSHDGSLPAAIQSAVKANPPPTCSGGQIPTLGTDGKLACHSQADAAKAGPAPTGLPGGGQPPAGIKPPDISTPPPPPSK